MAPLNFRGSHDQPQKTKPKARCEPRFQPPKRPPQPALTHAIPAPASSRSKAAETDEPRHSPHHANAADVLRVQRSQRSMTCHGLAAAFGPPASLPRVVRKKLGLPPPPPPPTFCFPEPTEKGSGSLSHQTKDVKSFAAPPADGPNSGPDAMPKKLPPRRVSRTSDQKHLVEDETRASSARSRLWDLTVPRWQSVFTVGCPPPQFERATCCFASISLIASVAQISFGENPSITKTTSVLRSSNFAKEAMTRRCPPRSRQFDPETNRALVPGKTVLVPGNGIGPATAGDGAG